MAGPPHNLALDRHSLAADPGREVPIPAVFVLREALGLPDRGVMDRSWSSRPLPRAETRTPDPPVAIEPPAFVAGRVRGPVHHAGTSASPMAVRSAG